MKNERIPDDINNLISSKDANKKTDNKEDKQKSFKHIYPKLIVTIIVVALLVFALKFFLYNDSSDSFVNDVSNIMMLDYNDYKFKLLSEGKASDIGIDASDITRSYSLNGEYCAVLSSEKSLSVIKDNKELIQVDENVSSFHIATVSGSVVYAKGNTLNLYDSKNKLGSEIFQGDVLIYHISPDGKKVVFVNDKTIYLYSDGETSEVCKDYFPICVSDKGVIYLVDQEKNDLYSYTDKLNLISDNITDNFFVNALCNEIIFSNVKSMYISIDGEPQRRVSSNEINYILPEKHITYNNFENVILGVNSLFDCLYIDGANNIFKLIDKYDSQADKYDSLIYNISSENYKLSNDGKKLVYISSGGELFIADTSKKSSGEKLASDVDSFTINSSAGLIAYVTKSGDLYRSNGKKSEKVGENVEYMQIGEKDAIYYITKDKTLYCAEKGKSPLKIESKVEALKCYSDCTYYAVDDGDGFNSAYGGTLSSGYSLLSDNSDFRF